MKINIEKENIKKPYQDEITIWKITIDEIVNEKFITNLCTKCLTKVDKQYNDENKKWYESYYELKKENDNTYIFEVTKPYLD